MEEAAEWERERRPRAGARRQEPPEKSALPLPNAAPMRNRRPWTPSA